MSDVSAAGGEIFQSLVLLSFSGGFGRDGGGGGSDFRRKLLIGRCRHDFHSNGSSLLILLIEYKASRFSPKSSAFYKNEEFR